MNGGSFHVTKASVEVEDIKISVGGPGGTEILYKKTYGQHQN